MKIAKIVIPVVILVVGFTAMRFLLSQRTDPPKKPPVQQVKIVQSVVVSLSSVPATITAFGRLTSSQPVQLYSEVKGLLLEGNVTFNPGQSFKKGDLLLKIDDRQARLDLNGVKSDFLNALASVLPEIRIDFLQDFQIWQDYFDNTSFDGPLTELPEAGNQKIKLFLSRFNVYKLFFSARNLEISLEKHRIYAPFDGAIVSTNMRVGSTARDGVLLGDIINLESLEVEVPVPVQDIQWIDRAKSVVFSSTEIAGQWHGRIKRIGKSIDTRTQTVPIYFSIDRARSELYEGVFLRAQIPGLDIPDAITLPQRVLYNDKYVYAVKDGRLDYRTIEIARKETDSVIVTGGIDAGDTLVVEVLQGVSPGMLARAKIMNEGKLATSFSVDSLGINVKEELP